MEHQNTTPPAVTLAEPQAPALLEVRNLKVHIQTGGNVVRAVDGVDLKVMPGECVGIVGESGSGK
ncbi:MAG: dipeptide ABC transporter ATP-binding protein DppD, partial [Burkholderiaceae bacterium]